VPGEDITLDKSEIISPLFSFSSFFFKKNSEEAIRTSDNIASHSFWQLATLNSLTD